MLRNKKIMIEGKCAVCNHPVMIDEIGNGEVCNNCGWRQDSAAKKLHYSVGIANPISLDKARRLYKEGKPFEPDFDDFIEFYEMYGEIEFKYNGLLYVMERGDNEAILFGECNVLAQEKVIPIVFANIDDFTANAKIDGILIKDLWNKIKNFDCLN